MIFFVKQKKSVPYRPSNIVNILKSKISMLKVFLPLRKTGLSLVLCYVADFTNFPQENAPLVNCTKRYAV